MRGVSFGNRARWNLWADLGRRRAAFQLLDQRSSQRPSEGRADGRIPDVGRPAGRHFRRQQSAAAECCTAATGCRSATAAPPLPHRAGYAAAPAGYAALPRAMPSRRPALPAPCAGSARFRRRAITGSSCSPRRRGASRAGNSGCTACCRSSSATSCSDGFPVIGQILSLCCFCGRASVIGFKRFHDLGYPGWYSLVYLIPFLAAAVIFSARLFSMPVHRYGVAAGENPLAASVSSSRSRN